MAPPSPPTTPMSQASTKIGHDSSVGSDEVKGVRRRAVERVKQATTARDVFLFLVAFRILNALSVKTFFQPDEFFQSLEPAWKIAFGADSGAWITWEWKNQLRSSIHPAIFAAVYWVTSYISKLLQLTPLWHAELLVNAPKVTQAVFAALGDYYTWKLGERVYGTGSKESWAALALTVYSPWQWFCSTRTFSNCLETTLTTIALQYWPWEWSIEPPAEEEEEDEDDESVRRSLDEDRSEELGRSAIDFWDDVMHVVEGQNNLRRCLLLAALACVLRPTNVLIWICIASFTLFRSVTYGRMVHLPWLGTPIWLHVTDITLFPTSKGERHTLFREAALCGTLILSLSLAADRLYYGAWAFPPFKFLYFNIAQSLAVFYGRNRHDYYFTEGLPLLLTTYLPFAIAGIYQGLFPPENNRQISYHSSSTIAAPPPAFTKRITSQLVTTTLLVPLFLSLISHKEVRFIYPLLPILHILASGPLVSFSLPSKSHHYPNAHTLTPSLLKRLTLLTLLLLNALIAFLASTSHQPGPLDVLTYLRTEHIRLHLSQPTIIPPTPNTPLNPPNSTPLLSTTSPIGIMTIGFLMPCHSTPWRSHLIFPTIHAWALTCEPPLHLTDPSDGEARASYLDEADRFYADPHAFLERELGPPPPSTKRPTFKIAKPASWLAWLLGPDTHIPSSSSSSNALPPSSPSCSSSASRIDEDGDTTPAEDTAMTADPPPTPWDGGPGRKTWPEYLVFFAQLEPVMRNVAGGDRSAYVECWRGWNSWGHDDWRRKGDVVVWCLRG